MFLAVNISFYYFFLFKHDYATSIYAEKGDPTAQLNLGSNYYQGWFGKPKDYGLALKWFQKAADQGNGMAQYYIGEMYELGLGVKEDRAQAVHWYSIAANSGERWAVTAIKDLNDPEHQVVVGYSFYKGHFRTHNFEKAFNCFQRAASQGNADAQGYLGEMYEKGEGVTKDKKMAVDWYIKAENNGNKSAKYALERLGVSTQK
jgi:TPR repeat protein